jgi:hypothetical protein
MRPIATVAAAQLRQVPDFLALKMPPKLSTSRALVAWAGAMGKAAAAYDKTFVDAGLSPDFLAQMQTAADTLNATLTSRGATRAAQRGASAGLDAEATRGRQAVKVLDALVEPLIAGDISLLAQWKTAKRVTGRSTPVAATSIDAAATGLASTTSTPPSAPIRVSVLAPSSPSAFVPTITPAATALATSSAAT